LRVIVDQQAAIREGLIMRRRRAD